MHGLFSLPKREKLKQAQIDLAHVKIKRLSLAASTTGLAEEEPVGGGAGSC